MGKAGSMRATAPGWPGTSACWKYCAKVETRASTWGSPARTAAAASVIAANVASRPCCVKLTSRL